MVALGAVIRGETDHYEHIAREAAAGLAAVARETGVPVGFGVLTVRTRSRPGRAPRPAREQGRRGRPRGGGHGRTTLRSMRRREEALHGEADQGARVRAADALPVGHHAGAHGPGGRPVLAGADDDGRDEGDGGAPGPGAREHVEQLDEAIATAATNWRFERIAAVDRNILRIGAYELMHEPQTPPSVIIDEAVEMAKRFGEADSLRS